MALDATTDDKPTNIAGERLRSIVERIERLEEERKALGSDIKDISFLNPSGQEMTDEDWNAGFTKCLGVRLAGDLIDDQGDGPLAIRFG